MINIVPCRDVTGQHGHAGMEDETHRRPSKRTVLGVDARKGYALRGAAAAVDAPGEARRRLQGEGTPPASARIATHLRVMCVGSGDAPGTSLIPSYYQPFPLGRKSNLAVPDCRPTCQLSSGSHPEQMLMSIDNGKVYFNVCFSGQLFPRNWMAIFLLFSALFPEPVARILLSQHNVPAQDRG